MTDRGDDDVQDRLELAVCRLVAAALKAEGRAVDVLGRPNPGDPRGPGADFLIAVDGAETALEVTRTADRMEQRTAQLNIRLRNRLVEILGGDIAAAQIGHAFATFDLAVRDGVAPRQRDIDQGAAEVAELIRAALSDAIRTGERLHLGETDIVDEVTLRVRPTQHHRVSIVWGGQAAFPAAAAVSRVVRSKTQQLAPYRRAYLALLEPTLLIKPHHLGEAFAGAADELPANWLRVYVITHDVDARAELIFDRQ